jgi:hypothetical protein
MPVATFRQEATTGGELTRMIIHSSSFASSRPALGRLSNEKFGPHKHVPSRSPEIVAGLLRVGQLAILCGYYSIGKSPLVQDLAFHVANGYTWLGRKVLPRPVFLFDFETQAPDYELNIYAFAARYGNCEILYPKAYLLSATRFTSVVTPLRGFRERTWQDRHFWIRSLLKESPDALFLFDPADLFFHFHRHNSSHVLRLFVQLRELLAEFPNAAIILVMNLRKRGRRRQPSLLAEPLRWLEDNAGDLDILNRADVRIGFDHFIDPAYRVLNGVRRGEEMMPIVMRSIGSPGSWSGFERVELPPEGAQLSLTKKQEIYFRLLPETFRFEDVVRQGLVPRSSLSRLIHACRAIGLLVSEAGDHRKI